MNKISIDFETYSDAGYKWDPARNKWINNKGLAGVGVSVYSEHPSTEVLCLYYDLHDGAGVIGWSQGDVAPQALFDAIATGRLVYAWNSAFEYYLWANVCHARMGWPATPFHQFRDDMARAAAWSTPASLDKCGKALGSDLKMGEGKALIRKFCVPRNPTKNDPSKRIMLKDDIFAAGDFLNYCEHDVIAEDAVSAKIPDLSPYEEQIFLLDQYINTTGCQIDMEAVNNCIAIVDQAIEKYTAEAEGITGGIKPTELSKLKAWIESRGVTLPNTQKETLEGLLKQPIPLDVLRVIQIRLSIGAASVKKLYSIKQRVSRDGRLRGMFQYCGASNTGRFAGRGPQPQNLPNSGPTKDWGIADVEKTYEIATSRSLGAIEEKYGNAVAAVAGSLRGLFCAAPGHDLICSDYSAIEARVLAYMAGEQWRMDVFKTHGKVYEMSAAKITGKTFEEIKEYPSHNEGDKHPSRKLGKVAELASGYGGWIGAWKAFGADKFLSDEEIKQAILKWRAASPNIVKFWSTLENDAKNAIRYPGRAFGMYHVADGVLYCTLPSGRKLNYHSATLGQNRRGDEGILFKGVDSKTKQWTWQETYGGKLTENIIQAVSRDILCHAMLQLATAGYKIVLHVHDEVISEVSQGWGSIEEFEKIMGQMPDWCADWPIVAAGGWRGNRYRKD